MGTDAGVLTQPDAHYYNEHQQPQVSHDKPNSYESPNIVKNHTGNIITQILNDSSRVISQYTLRLSRLNAEAAQDSARAQSSLVARTLDHKIVIATPSTT